MSDVTAIADKRVIIRLFLKNYPSEDQKRVETFQKYNVFYWGSVLLFDTQISVNGIFYVKVERKKLGHI